MPSLRRISRWTRSSRRYGASSPKTSGRAAPGARRSRRRRVPRYLAAVGPSRTSVPPTDRARRCRLPRAGGRERCSRSDRCSGRGRRRHAASRRCGLPPHRTPPLPAPPHIETEAAEPTAVETKPAEAGPRTDRPPPAEASPESDRAADPGPTPPAAPSPAAPPAAANDERLVSDVAALAAATAFGRLAAAPRVRREPPLVGDRPLDEIVRDLLRPLLQTWLDENLPGIVERLVAGGNRPDFGPVRAGLSRSRAARSRRAGSATPGSRRVSGRFTT